MKSPVPPDLRDEEAKELLLNELDVSQQSRYIYGLMDAQTIAKTLRENAGKSIDDLAACIHVSPQAMHLKQQSLRPDWLKEYCSALREPLQVAINQQILQAGSCFLLQETVDYFIDDMRYVMPGRERSFQVGLARAAKFYAQGNPLYIVRFMQDVLTEFGCKTLSEFHTKAHAGTSKPLDYRSTWLSLGETEIGGKKR